MKTKILLLSFITIIVLTACSPVVRMGSSNTDLVTISGKVTNFEGIAIDSAVVQILRHDFTTAYETYTDRNGNYCLNILVSDKTFPIMP